MLSSQNARLLAHLRHAHYTFAADVVRFILIFANFLLVGAGHEHVVLLDTHLGFLFGMGCIASRAAASGVAFAILTF